MKGIRLSHGAVFVTDGLWTVRLLPSGKCTPSPISYAILEHDMASEPPSRWEYIGEGEILSLPNGGGEKIVKALEKLHGKKGKRK